MSPGRIGTLRSMCVVVLLSLVSFLLILAGSVRAQTAPTSGPAAATDGAPRAVMPERSAAVIVKVADFEAAREQVVQSLSGLGAELVDARTEVDPKGRRHGWLKVALPIERLPDALPAVRSAGKVYAEKVNTEDSTSEYESLARRVERLRQHQQRLAGILNSERRLRGSDILFVQERLFRAGVDEEMLTQQREDIARESRVCLLTVSLFEPEPARELDRMRLDVAGHFARAREHALALVDRTRARAVTAAAYALVFAPVWVPLFLLGLTLAVFVLRFAIRLVRDVLWPRRQALLAGLIARLRAVQTAFLAVLPERGRSFFTAVGTVTAAAVRPAGGGTAPANVSDTMGATPGE